MGRLSDKLNSISFGDTGTKPQLQRCTLNATNGAVTAYNAGSDLILSGSGASSFKAEGKVFNSVWMDFADFQLLCDDLVFGKCYMDTKDGAMICTERCQMSVIGLASDTFGMSVGAGAYSNQVPIAVAGWALAYVDQEYKCGTVLTNDENGNLTAMTREEKLEYPERIVGIYKRKEMEEFWGPAGRQIKVDGRHWIKVK